MKNNLAKPQRMGSGLLLIMCILINMLSSFSSDIYLPALPDLCNDLNASASQGTMTITAFILFYALGTLVGGPLCDKYGRKGILVGGSICFLIGTIGCILAPGLNLLIGARVVAGIGAGLLTSDSFAIVHECYEGETGEKNIALVQSIASVGPILAPVFGSLILNISGSWRAIFLVIVIIGVFITLLSFMYEESLAVEERIKGGIFETLGRLIVVGKNPSILFPLIIFALSSFIFLGYVGVSSYIYQNYYGLSDSSYSMFYALAACMAVVGPMIYMKVWINVDKNLMSKLCFLAMLFCGIAIVTVAPISHFIFFVIIAVFTFFIAILRPFSMNILFAQTTTDSGSVSALYNCINFVLGSVGMTVTTMGWSNLVVSFGVILTVVALVELVGWIILMKSSIPCNGVK